MEDVVQYECMLPHQLEKRISACPLVYIPVGSLEWHCEHLPVGNDSIKMHALCCEAARAGGGVVFPPLYFGILGMIPYGAKYRYPANLPVSPDFLTGILRTTLEGLEKVGFRAAILTTGHTCEEQRALMRTVAGGYRGAMRVYGTDDMEWAKDMDFNSDHAGKWETSILWHLRPELVDVRRLPGDIAVPLEGVYGDDPRLHASRELGERVVASIARDLARKGRQLLDADAG